MNSIHQPNSWDDMHVLFIKVSHSDLFDWSQPLLGHQNTSTFDWPSVFKWICILWKCLLLQNHISQSMFYI